MLNVLSDEYFMKLALNEAQKAFENNEIPVGVVVVDNGKIISKCHNQVELLQDVTAHAEMIAITSSQNFLGSKYLEDCVMYITLEPCCMCAGALYWTKINHLVIATQDEEKGFSKYSPSIIHPRTTYEFGLMKKEASQLVKEFFKKIRKK